MKNFKIWENKVDVSEYCKFMPYLLKSYEVENYRNQLKLAEEILLIGNLLEEGWNIQEKLVTASPVARNQGIFFLLSLSAPLHIFPCWAETIFSLPLHAQQ